MKTIYNSSSKKELLGSKINLLILFFCTSMFLLIIPNAKAQEWEKKKPNILYAVPHQYEAENEKGEEGEKGKDKDKEKEKDKDSTQLLMKVGIGTNNPKNALDVVGDVHIKGYLTVDSMRVPGGLHIGDSSLYLNGGVVGTTGTSSDQIISSAGNLVIGHLPNFAYVQVGIGTWEPQAKLHLHNEGIDPIFPDDCFMLFTTARANYNTTNGFQVGISANGNAIINQRQNLPMLFKTNDLERMWILNNGNIGIGTPTPNSKLEINSGSPGISGLQFTTLTNASAALANPLKKVLSVDNTGKVILVNDAEGTTGTGTGDVTGCAGTTADNNYLTKWTDATNKTICKSIVYADNFGVGIGTKFNTDPGNNPKARLDISGAGQQWINIASDDPSSAFMQLLANGGGNNISQIRYKGLFYIGSYTSSLASISFDDNGNVGIGDNPASGMKFYVAGPAKFAGNVTYTSNVGIGIVPTGYKLDVVGPARFNGNMAVTGTIATTGTMTTTGNVGIGTTSPAFLLDVGPSSATFQNTYAHRGDDKTTWDTKSDIRLKTDINPFTDGLAVIKQINTVTYRYNGKANTDNVAQHIGVIAQDVQKVAPYTVGTYIAPMDSTDIVGTELLSFNPHGLFFVLINAVKQLDSVNTNLAAKDSAKSVTIDSLKTALVSKDSAMEARMLALEARMEQCCQNSSSSGLYKMGNNNSATITQKEVELKTDEVVLDQNNPNPFKETTTISYYIPAHINYAQIIFYDNTGRIIKTVDVNEKGQGQLNVKAENMSNGIYTYSIVVDGVIIDTKKMIKLH